MWIAFLLTTTATATWHVFSDSCAYTTSSASSVVFHDPDDAATLLDLAANDLPDVTGFGIQSYQLLPIAMAAGVPVVSLSDEPYLYPFVSDFAQWMPSSEYVFKQLGEFLLENGVSSVAVVADSPNRLLLLRQGLHTSGLRVSSGADCSWDLERFFEEIGFLGQTVVVADVHDADCLERLVEFGTRAGFMIWHRSEESVNDALYRVGSGELGCAPLDDVIDWVDPQSRALRLPIQLYQGRTQIDPTDIASLSFPPVVFDSWTVDDIQLSPWHFYVGGTVGSLVGLGTLIFGVNMYRRRKQKGLRILAPNLLFGVILASSIFAGAVPWLYPTFWGDALLCSVRMWLVGVLWTIIFLLLTLKTLRVHVLFTRKNWSVPIKISDTRIYGFVAVCVLLETGCWAVAFLELPMQLVERFVGMTVRHVSMLHLEQSSMCARSEGVIPLVAACLWVGLRCAHSLAFLVVTFKARRLRVEMNETTWLFCVGIFNLFLIGAGSLVFTFAQLDAVSAYWLEWSLCALYGTVPWMTIVIPKMAGWKPASELGLRKYTRSRAPTKTMLPDTGAPTTTTTTRSSDVNRNTHEMRSSDNLNFARSSDGMRSARSSDVMRSSDAIPSAQSSDAVPSAQSSHVTAACLHKASTETSVISRFAQINTL